MMRLEFSDGIVVRSEIVETDIGLRGWGFIRPDDSAEDVWFGSNAAVEMIRTNDRVKYVLASSPSSKSGRPAASVVRLAE